MRRQMRARFWIEGTLAVASGLLFTLTLFWHEWIEAIFRVDPDQGSGALEWAVVAVLFVMTVTFTLLARAERKDSFLRLQR